MNIYLYLPWSTLVSGLWKPFQGLFQAAGIGPVTGKQLWGPLSQMSVLSSGGCSWYSRHASAQCTREMEEMGEMEESEVEIWNVQIATGFSDGCKHWVVGEGNGSY